MDLINYMTRLAACRLSHNSQVPCIEGGIASFVETLEKRFLDAEALNRTRLQLELKLKSSSNGGHHILRVLSLSVLNQHIYLDCGTEADRSVQESISIMSIIAA